MNAEANIRISRSGNELVSIDVLMPVWSRTSDHGHLVIKLPLLGIETVARDEADSDTAIEEAIASFCIAAEKFGHGLECELQCLGWHIIDETTGEPALGYSASDPDSLIERLIQTGENFVKEHIKLNEKREPEFA